MSVGQDPRRVQEQREDECRDAEQTDDEESDGTRWRVGGPRRDPEKRIRDVQENVGGGHPPISCVDVDVLRSAKGTPPRFS